MYLKRDKNMGKYNIHSFEVDIDHFATTSTKQDKDWYVPTIRYYYEKLNNINDKSKTLDYLNAANGLYNDEVKRRFLKLINADKYVEEIKDLDVLTELDLISPITRRIIGEFIRQPDNDYTCKLGDSSAIMKLNIKVRDKVTKLLMDRLMARLQQLDEEAKQKNEQLPELNLQEEIEKITQEYFEDEAEKAKAIVDTIISTQRLTETLKQQFYYLYATEEVYTLLDTQNDKLDVLHIPPTDYYRYPSGLSNNVEDDIAGMYKYKLSYYEFLDTFKDKLSETDYEYIKNLYTSVTSSNNYNTTEVVGLISKHFDYYNYNYTTSDITTISDNIKSIYNNTGLVDVARIFIRTKRKYGILEYINPFTNTVEYMEVADDYKVNKAKGDISIQWLYKDEIMESYLFGDVNTGVYTKPEYLKYKREILNNVETTKLPIVGKSGLLVSLLHQPLPYRIIGLNIIYKFLHIKIQSEIAKFQGFINIIPESILSTSQHFKLEERLDYLFQSNLLFIDDSQSSANTLQSIRTIGSYQKEYIEQLQAIKDSIKQEAWELVDMNYERYGNIDTRGGKANTQEAIARVSTGSLLLFETFDNYLERLYQAIADYTRLLSTSGMQAVQFSPTGKPININISSDELMYMDLNITFKKSAIEAEKVNFVRSTVLQAAAQNQEFLLAIEAVDKDDIYSIKKVAKKIKESAEKRAMYLEQVKAQIEQAKIEREDRKDENAYNIKIDTEHVKGNYDLLLKDKELLMKMIEYTSFNPESTEYKSDISNLSSEIEKAELEIKKKQSELLTAKIKNERNKPKSNSSK